MTQNVVSRREETELCPLSGARPSSDSGGVDGSGVHQHDRNVVLNGVHTAAFAAFQTIPVRGRKHWLFANRADQHVKQILRNHNRSILQWRGRQKVCLPPVTSMVKKRAG